VKNRIQQRKCGMKKFLLTIVVVLSAGGWPYPVLAQTTNLAGISPLTAPELPGVGPSLLRVFGALALVIGIFLGGVWLFRNWQRLIRPAGHTPKLNLIETRPLGGRQTLYVVGYEQERFLLAASPAGISLLSHLPDAVADEAPAGGKTPPTFPQILAQMLKGK
jgi:flagellar biogenesis protein FliO